VAVMPSCRHVWGEYRISMEITQIRPPTNAVIDAVINAVMHEGP
jgi:hypothetical protein